MKTEIAVQKLDHFLNTNKHNVVDNLIVRENNHYYLFGGYIITKNNKTKKYCATKRSGTEKLFNSLSSATGWCVADKFCKYQLAKSIVELDRRKAILSDDLEVERFNLLRVKDPVKAEIIGAKVTEKIASLSGVEFQLTKCIKLAKYWQTKGFICNETARPRNY